MEKTIWRLTGEEIGSCTCAWGCPCQFNAIPIGGRCAGQGVCRIVKGHYGDLALDGARFAFMVSFPGAMHEGNGTWQAVIDAATPEQRQALEEIIGGRVGGVLFEIFAAVCPNRLPVVFAPIEFEADLEARRGKYKVGTLAEGVIEPIRNPVTKEEHRARINLPNGFEYKTAEVGNSVDWRMSGELPLRMQHQNTYAQLNEFDWSNL